MHNTIGVKILYILLFLNLYHQEKGEGKKIISICLYVGLNKCICFIKKKRKKKLRELHAIVIYYRYSSIIIVEINILHHWGCCYNTDSFNRNNVDKRLSFISNFILFDFNNVSPFCHYKRGSTDLI